MFVYLGKVNIYVTPAHADVRKQINGTAGNVGNGLFANIVALASQFAQIYPWCSELDMRIADAPAAIPPPNRQTPSVVAC